MSSIVGEAYINKMKNRVYGVLCEREKEGDWEGFLDSLLIELYGVSEDSKTIDYYIIYHRLSSCRYLNYKYFRKTIFDVMTMLSRWEVII